jgi:hypothetical protein
MESEEGASVSTVRMLDDIRLGELHVDREFVLPAIDSLRETLGNICYFIVRQLSTIDNTPVEILDWTKQFDESDHMRP